MSESGVLATPTAVGEFHRDPDGSLHGWCWYPDQPMLRATVDLVRDKEPVRAVRASRPRSELRDRGMGDGHYGFWFPQPPGVLADGSRVVLEVRERRLGLTIGRIVVGSHDAGREGQLSAAATGLARTAAALDGLRPGPNAAATFGTLGRILLHLAGRPIGQRGLGPPGLQACLQHVAQIPVADLGWCARPRISVIVTARGDLDDLAGRIKGVAHVLHSADPEFLLVDDGSLPLAALLPTRLRGLMLVRVPAWPGRGAALNAAAAAARGEILAIARPGGPGLAGMDGASIDPGFIGLDAGLVPGLVAPGPLRRNGLHCLIRRADLADMGGFDPWADEAGMWADILQKAQALGLSLTTWSTPQAAQLPERAG